MNLLGTPRRMPSMAAGYGLEIAGYISKENL
jgi:3,4-dihydroxy 2-butanone 4-phosphate synthase/GTP cyclohydrolase II